jgi:hypothetical protein
LIEGIMRTMLQRLLKYPHRAMFDTSPGAVQAFRLSHPDGAVWAIADEVMTVAAGHGQHWSENCGLLAVAELRCIRD